MTGTDARKAGKPKHGSTPTRIVYDVIVLGAQLAGALAGALLVKRGYRVLHIDTEGLGGSYEHKGYQLPYAPSLMPHLRRLPPAEAALTELGVAVDLFRALDAGGEELQLLFPRHRLDLVQDAARRSLEIGREFAGQRDAVLSALGSVQARAEATDPFFRLTLPFPPGGFFERRAVNKAAAGFPAMREDGEVLAGLRDTPLADALGSLSRFMTHLEDKEAGSLARLRPAAQLLSGAYRFPGGMAGLREAVRARLAELGGEILGDATEPADVEELLFEGGRFSGVKLAHSTNVYRASCLVVGMDVASLAPLIPPKAKKHGLSDLLESVRVRRHLLAANVVVRDEGLPLGLKSLALVHPGDEEHGAVLLEVQPARKAGKDVPGEKVLCAAAFVSHGEHSNSEERVRSLVSRVEGAALALAPFVEPHVVLRSAPYLDARQLKGSRLLYHPLMEFDADRSLGVGGLPARTPCRNLFLASREVVPGLGVEGEFVAGTRAAALVKESLKKHDPLK